MIWSSYGYVSTCSCCKVMIHWFSVRTCMRHNMRGVLSDSFFNMPGSQIEFHWSPLVFGVDATRLGEQGPAGVIAATGTQPLQRRKCKRRLLQWEVSLATAAVDVATMMFGPHGVVACQREGGAALKHFLYFTIPFVSNGVCNLQNNSYFK